MSKKKKQEVQEIKEEKFTKFVINLVGERLVAEDSLEDEEF